MRYKAFISYSHQDERWGARLHKRLETFKFPRRVIGQQTDRGPVPENLKPVFRDKVELSAGANLSEALQRRLRESENLIVICSPRSAQSYWVNEEILFFKRHNNPDNIFAFIIDGEPNAENPDDECFPPALKFALDDQGEQTGIRAEPLAADARKEGEGPRMALLQVLSGMAGLGLDDLVRRDLQRARRRVTLITVSAISAMIVMGALTGIALDARGEAEARKDDAEGLIEFMLTDLRDKLEPVGRLDALDAVGQRASDYYNQYDLDGLDADSVGRYAQINHLLGDIQLRMGNISEAKKYFEPVYETTKRQLEADPDNPDRIYEHIQSVFWVARPFEKAGDKEKFFEYQTVYLELANRLNDMEQDSVRSKREMAYGLSNVGRAQHNRRNFSEAQTLLEQSIFFYEDIAHQTQTPQSLIELSIAYSDLADTIYWVEAPLEAYKWQRKRSDLLSGLRAKHPNNFNVLTSLIWSNLRDMGYLLQFKDYDKLSKISDHTFALVEEAKNVEPKHDQILRAEITLYDYIIQIAKEQADQKTVEENSIIYGELLAQRTQLGNSGVFDQEWDYVKPFIYIRRKMTSRIMAGDIDGAKRYLAEFEHLMERIRKLNGEQAPYFTTKAFHLMWTAFLTQDRASFKQTKNPEFKKALESSALILKLMEYKFCTENENCDASEIQFTKADTITDQFTYFKKAYPKTALTIEQSLSNLRREK